MYDSEAHEELTELSYLSELLDDPTVTQEKKLRLMDGLLNEMSRQEDLSADFVVDFLRLMVEIGIGNSKTLELMETVIAIREEGIDVQDVIIH